MKFKNKQNEPIVTEDRTKLLSGVGMTGTECKGASGGGAVVVLIKTCILKGVMIKFICHFMEHISINMCIHSVCT